MKPWYTKKWKKMREERLADECKQCGSSEGPLVIQHFSHNRTPPPSKMAIAWPLMLERGLIPNRPTQEKRACSHCRGQVSDTNKRKVARPPWRCPKCKGTFETPIMVNVNVPSTHNLHKKWREEVLYPAMGKFTITHSEVFDPLYKKALLKYETIREQEYEHYISGKDTATFCKKCAYLWDMKEQMLCSKCKKYYHAFHYEQCFHCLPEERKKIEEEKRLVEYMVSSSNAFLESADQYYANLEE